MEQQTQQLLQVSVKLYEQLSKNPQNEERDPFIEQISQQLDERGVIIEELGKIGFEMDINNQNHMMLAELDKGIHERLNLVLTSVKQDMKDLQNAKKNEKQYMNPYSDVRVMDGMYYDKKK